MSELAGWTVDEMRHALASPRADVGGGTAVLVGASFGASLLAMAAAVTLKHAEPPGLAGFRSVVQEAAARLLELAEEDGRSYGRVIEARRLPRDTEEQRAERERRVEEALEAAIRIPLDAAGACRDLLGICERLLDMCRPVTHSDLGSGALLLAAGVRGSLFNARQNCAGRPDAGPALQRADDLQRATEELTSRILLRVEKNA